MDLRLKGKTALVTGGGGGLGAGICQALAAEGVNVAVADVNEQSARRMAQMTGGLSIAMDVRHQEQIDAGLDRIRSTFGDLHIVVSNVGLTLPDYLSEMSDADINTTFDVNMRGPLQLVRSAAPQLAHAGWGRLIFIGSGSGMKASAGLGVYSASKYFLHGLSVAAAMELGPKGITANIVCPSDIYPQGDNPAGSWRNAKLLQISQQKEGVGDFEALKTRRISRTPVRRSCTIQDVADTVTFLASPRADFINAQVIGVNGGLIPN